MLFAITLFVVSAVAGFLAAWSSVAVFHAAVMSAIAVSVCFGDACWSGFFFLVFWGCLDPSFCADWFKSLLEGCG